MGLVDACSRKRRIPHHDRIPPITHHPLTGIPGASGPSSRLFLVVLSVAIPVRGREWLQQVSVSYLLLLVPACWRLPCSPESECCPRRSTIASHPHESTLSASSIHVASPYPRHFAFVFALLTTYWLQCCCKHVDASIFSSPVLDNPS